MSVLQPLDELEKFYDSSDPWDYDNNPDDAMRREMLLSEIPKRQYERVLDIGCGNGFITERLPGKEIVGVDISAKAIEWARKRCREPKFSFEVIGILELSKHRLGTFDLVVVTGVLYPQYIGKANSLALLKIDEVLRPKGILLHVHILDWFKIGFPYDQISTHVYPYREYTHLIEVHRK